MTRSEETVMSTQPFRRVAVIGAGTMLGKCPTEELLAGTTKEHTKY